MRIVFLLALIIPIQCLAGTNYEDWIVEEYDAGSIAYTTNPSGSTLGYICKFSTKNCHFFFDSGSRCDEDSVSKALVNSDIGALAVDVICQKYTSEGKQKHYSMLGNYDEISEAILKANSIGIAIPLASGQFKVLKFSLKGSNQAVISAAKIAADSNTDTVL